MIVRLNEQRRPKRPWVGIPELDTLHDFWSALRAGDGVPRAEELYLTDLVETMPFLLLAYRHGRGFRIEFAGDVASRLIGTDLTGACPTRRDPDPLRASLARGIGTADGLTAAGAGRLASGDGALAAIYLPFADAVERPGPGSVEGGAAPAVALVMVGLARDPRPAGGDVLRFERPPRRQSTENT